MTDTPNRPPLSPAAQAVLDAFRAVPDPRDCPSLAAAIRALASHKIVARFDIGIQDHWSPDERTRRELQNIAAELEGAQ